MRTTSKLNINWRVGETVNSLAFHASIHGFESRTRHHWKMTRYLKRYRFFCVSGRHSLYSLMKSVLTVSGMIQFIKEGANPGFQCSGTVLSVIPDQLSNQSNFDLCWIVDLEDFISPICLGIGFMNHYFVFVD